jgi:hypothetical protein
LKLFQKYTSLISTGVALLLVAMLLLPLGLKLEHTLSFHNESNECTQSKTHIHSEGSHDDLLDGFFQPLIYTSFHSVADSSSKIELKISQYYQYLFHSKLYKGVGLRAPPVFIFT